MSLHNRQRDRSLAVGPKGEHSVRSPPTWSKGAARIELDRNGLVTAWSEEAEALYGYSEREVIGRSAASLMVPLRRRRHAKECS
jgi:PAS domain-containing protein